MAGMTDLQQMLATLAVQRRPGEFVYVMLPTVQAASELEPEAIVREVEGVTAVVERSKADRAALTYDYVAAWLTLEVHSALEAVGLTAAFSKVLGEAGISCNVIAGLFHDHLLVPAAEAEAAVEALEALRDGHAWSAGVGSAGWPVTTAHVAAASLVAPAVGLMHRRPAARLAPSRVRNPLGFHDLPGGGTTGSNRQSLQGQNGQALQGQNGQALQLPLSPNYCLSADNVHYVRLAEFTCRGPRTSN